MKKILFFLSVSLLLFSCSSRSAYNVDSGQIKWIPWSSNYFVGTDSSIVIVNRDNGEILSVIKRNQ